MKRDFQNYLKAFEEALGARSESIPHQDPEQPGVILDPHQREAMWGLYEGIIMNDQRRLCAVASCGSGKTLVEVAAVSASQEAKKNLGINGGRKDLILTVERTIVSGIREEFASLGMETGIWGNGKKELEPSVIIATVQAAQMAAGRNDIQRHFPQGSIDLLVLDEVDKFLTESRQRLVTLLSPSIAVGFTATDQWNDGRHISDAYGPVVHQLPLREAMRQQVNVVPEFYIFESQIEERSIARLGNDYDPSDLASALKHAEIHKGVVEVYNELLPAELQQSCPTLVYVPSRDLVQAVVASMQERYPNLAINGLTGEDPAQTVENTLNGFREGSVQVIVLCEMGGRGMNLENAHLLIDAYPTMSLNKLEQRHGRVLRKIRPGSPLWQKGWRKEGAVIAQIVPHAGAFRPALFTDIIGGYQELHRLRERGSGGGDGAPRSDIISEIRRRIEAARPDHSSTILHRITQVEMLERLMRETPREDDDGFLRMPRRYVRAMQAEQQQNEESA